MKTRITTVEVEGRTFDVFTLNTYVTPYFYVEELGSTKHFRTLQALKNAIRRHMAASVERSFEVVR